MTIRVTSARRNVNVSAHTPFRASSTGDGSAIMTTTVTNITPTNKMRRHHTSTTHHCLHTIVSRCDRINGRERMLSKLLRVSHDGNVGGHQRIGLLRLNIQTSQCICQCVNNEKSNANTYATRPELAPASTEASAMASICVYVQNSGVVHTPQHCNYAPRTFRAAARASAHANVTAAWASRCCASHAVAAAAAISAWNANAGRVLLLVATSAADKDAFRASACGTRPTSPTACTRKTEQLCQGNVYDTFRSEISPRSSLIMRVYSDTWKLTLCTAHQSYRRRGRVEGVGNHTIACDLCTDILGTIGVLERVMCILIAQ